MEAMDWNVSCQWSSLPSDLIHLISTKLPDLSDRVRVRAVCKAWRSSVSVSDPSPRLPWFLGYRADGNDEILYYSLSSKKTYKIHCQQLRDTYFEGAVGGFIRCCRDGQPESVFLFNPLNGLEISLPSHKYNVVYFVVSNPLQEDIVAVVGVERPISDMWMGFIRPGEDAWVTRSTNMCFDAFVVCVYHQGLYYVNEYNAHTWIEDATTGEFLSSTLSPVSHQVSCQYMLQACGEILLIFQIKPADKFEEISFEIYRLDEVRGGYEWVRIKDIGDRMLFLNRFGGFSLRDSELPGFKGNCIYFMDIDVQYDLESDDSVLLCRHDLENGTTEALPNFWGKHGTWIIPTLAE